MGVSVGPFGGSTFVDDSTVGTVSLTNAGNASASDGTFVTWALLLSQLGHYLKATGFGFNLSPDCTILGIKVEIQQQTTVGTSVTDNSVKLVKGGTIGGTEKATGTQWPTSEAYQTYGSSSDLWGQVWTPADINLSTFGVAVSPNCGAAATAEVDYIRITITYDPSNRPRNLFPRFKSGSGMSCVERAS